MSFDKVLETKLHPLGKWQIQIFCMIIFVSNTPLALIPQLANIGPDFVCSASWFDHWSYSQVLNFSKQIFDITHRDDNSTEYPNFGCQRYNLSGILDHHEISSIDVSASDSVLQLLHNVTVSMEKCPGSWIYDKENAVYRRSLVEDFNLVCDRRALIPHSAAWSAAGLGVGSLVSGPVGDRYGRRIVLCIFFPITAFLAIGMAFVRNFIVFIVFRFFIALTHHVAYISGYVMFLEITGYKHRNLLCVIDGAYYYVIGTNIVNLLSYVLQDWRWVHLSFGVIIMWSLFYTCFLPESPAWLMAKRRYEEAVVVIRQAFVINGGSEEEAKTITSAALDRIDASDKDENEISSHKDKEKVACADWCSFMFSKRTLRRIVPLVIIWFCVCCAFYTISFYSVRIEGNPYLIAFILSLMTLPPKALQWFLYHKFDRKHPIIALLTLSSILCLVGGLCQLGKISGVVAVVMSTTCYAVLTVAFDMLYMYTPELFPVSHSNSALGVCSTVSRVGMFSGMFIERLDELVWPPLPLILTSILLLVATISSVVLPHSLPSAEIKCDEGEEMLGIA